MRKIKDLGLKELDLSDLLFCINTIRNYGNKEKFSLELLKDLKVDVALTYLVQLKNKLELELKLNNSSTNNLGVSHFYLYKTSEFMIKQVENQL